MSDPCLAVARAILGALNAPDGVLLKCGRTEGHEPPHRFLMEWTDPAPTSERSGLVTDQISAYLASCREDPALRARVKERIARDAEILRRLDDETPDAGQREAQERCVECDAVHDYPGECRGQHGVRVPGPDAVALERLTEAVGGAESNAADVAGVPVNVGDLRRVLRMIARADRSPEQP